MKTRLSIDIVLIILAFLGPWWLVMTLGAVACFYFVSYFELVGLGLIIDSLYNAPVDRLFHVQFVLTFLALVVLVVSDEVRNRLRLQ